jgi:hypothetical protein
MDGDNINVLGSDGDPAGLDKDGKVVWQKNLASSAKPAKVRLEALFENPSIPRWDTPCPAFSADRHQLGTSNFRADDDR